MKLTIAIAAAALAVFGFSTTASAQDQGPTPSFDSDCAGTQWVIRNRGLEPFNIGTPAGDIYMAVDATWNPTVDLDSVTIADTTIVRPNCGTLAPARLPDTGASLTLALLAGALVAFGSVALRLGRRS
jgi:hypothetical protein